jgi:hypothetical protein
MAEEIVTAMNDHHHHGNAWKFGTGGGLLGFVVLILDILVFSMWLPSPSTVPIPSPFLNSTLHCLPSPCNR